MKNKTFAYVTALTAATVAGAHAQAFNGYDTGTTAYETQTVTSSDTDGATGVTTQVTTQYTSSTTVVPQDVNVIGDAPGTLPETADGVVKVKVPGGEVLTIADSEASPWAKNPQLQGYDRFTFDPVNGVFVAGKGDDKFAGNWDENGNRVKKAAAPAPKKAKKKVAAPAAEEAPAVEAPTEAPPVDAAPVETPAEAPAEVPAGTTGH